MFDIELIIKFRFEKTSGETIIVMAATLFKLNSLESETDKEMTTTSKIVVQYQETFTDRKSITEEESEF